MVDDENEGGNAKSLMKNVKRRKCAKRGSH
jgi:hypothetical protein